MASKLLSYIHVPHPCPMDIRSLHSYLDSVPEDRLDDEALIMYEMDMTRCFMTFREFRDWSAHLATSLLDLGLSRGDHVLLIGVSSVRYAVSIMALHRIGANTILLGPGGMTEDKVELLKTLDLKAIVFDPVMKTSQQEQLKAGLLDLISAQVVVTLQDEESCQVIDTQREVQTYQGLLDRGTALGLEALQEAQDQIQPDDRHVVFFTSGSTGAPKLVQCTMQQHCNIMSSMANNYNDLDDVLSPDSQGVTYHDRPMVWGGGYYGILRAAAGKTIVWVPTEMPLSDETNEAVFEIWEKEKCTSVLLSVPLIYRLSSGKFHEKYDLSRITSFLVGGQRYSAEMVDLAFECLPSATGLLVYGSIEGGFVSMETYKKETFAKEEYGKMAIFPGNEMKLLTKKGKIVPRGIAGEICVRNHQLFLCYLGNPVATREAMSPTGWYSMGDIGKMDQEGRIEVLARKKEFIKRATVKIFPGEVESVVLKHPYVSDALVIGVPDLRFYEEICACIILKDQEQGSTEARLAELEAWCAEQWPPGADGLSLKPKYFIPMERFPWGKTAKIDKIALRRIAMEKLGIKGIFV